MRRKRALAAACVLMLLLCPSIALCETEGDAAIGDGVETWLDGVDWHSLQKLIDTLPEETRALWSGVSMRELTGELALSGAGNGDGPWARARLLLMGKQLLGSTLSALAGTLATLIGLILIGALCGALSEDGEGAQGAAAFVCRCFTLALVLSAFGALAVQATACMQSLCDCMEIAMPVLMTLLTAIGGNASAGVLQPSMALLTGGVAGSIRSLVIPLLLCSGVLAMFDHLSERIRLNEMSGLINSVIKWSIGIVTTLYTAITSLRGMAAAAFDGVSVRTAKYAAGSAFPMVGGLVGGSFDTVLGCAGLVKNAAGLTTILLCVSIALGPMIRLAASMLLFRLTAAALQPVAEKNQVAMCRAGADMLTGLLSACAAVTAMFIITVGLAVALGNAGMLS